ncbi:MAG: Glucose-1-phosphate thymidylyltransferase 1 [Alphaproteobacteria bacterium MarineAlpha3_Bin7]|nr:MAG: Glucose-1-phosphate thymidylyltransferase 1 [Alphaproteobacteria bacterium MarineAlpha3_Bin7]|tara:strand:+ start:2679 stop:3548 length:870 start_codon:yes stop_codon:yes gene_type:complete
MANKKGIILAGGSGTRLFPITSSVNKHLLPVFNKPMVYYSLSVLMLADIKDYLIVTNPQHINSFKNLFDDGQQLGISIQYAEQKEANGIAEAFKIGRKFIANDPVTLILGDNILFGAGLRGKLQEVNFESKAAIFSYEVKDPERYGVVELDNNGRPKTIEEKPKTPKSRLAIPGLYMYPNDVIDKVNTLKPSARGELEITDLNKLYLEENRLQVIPLSRGYAWLDAGTERALLEASNFISAIEDRQGLRIGSIEEIAWQMGWITQSQLAHLGQSIAGSEYGKYLINISE